LQQLERELIVSKVRGIRGAIQVDQDNKESILRSTAELLEKMIKINEVDTQEIVSIFFTSTDDLNAEYPAYAAREMGLTEVPLLCSRELNISKAMARLIRILIHVNTNKTQNEIRHLYLGATKSLRPDLSVGD